MEAVDQTSLPALKVFKLLSWTFLFNLYQKSHRKQMSKTLCSGKQTFGDKAGVRSQASVAGLQGFQRFSNQGKDGPLALSLF